MRYNANEISSTSDKYIFGEIPSTDKYKDKGYISTDIYPYPPFDTELVFNVTPYLK